MRSITKRASTAVAAVALLGSAALATPAAAYAPAYVAGTASVSPITYNATTGMINWSCSFTGWVATSKYWACEQWNSERTYVHRSYGGNWSGETLHTRTFSQPDNINFHAYRAVAGYNDGSSSASSWRWG